MNENPVRLIWGAVGALALGLLGYFLFPTYQDVGVGSWAEALIVALLGFVVGFTGAGIVEERRRR